MIYSALLARGNQSGGGEVTIFTAPASLVTVVRTIAIYAYGLTTEARVGVTGIATMADLINSTGHPLGEVFNGRWVLNAGDEVYVNFVTSGGEYYVSGYLLTP